MDSGLGGNSGLNALTSDKAGNVYVSDSFQGVIWKTGPTGGAPTVFVDSQTLSPQAANGVILVPPFGANGVEFDHKFTAMFVANTAYHSIVKVPVRLNHDGSVSLAGPAAVLTTGINAPDGIAVDRRDNLWVVANQQDEVDVIDPNAIDPLDTRCRKSSPGGAISTASTRTERSAACSSRRARRSAPAANSFMSPTSRSTCPTPEYRSRRSTRHGRSKSSTTRSPKFAPKSLH
jgi:hypothetical protein